MWDESQLAPGSPIGGVCVSPQQAQAMMTNHAPFLQDLQVTLSSDGNLDNYEGGLPGNGTSSIR